MSHDDEQSTPLLPIGGIWETESKRTGKKYLSGPLFRGCNILIFKNQFKTKPGDPDYQMFIGRKRSQRREEQPDQSESPPIDEDDLPF